MKNFSLSAVAGIFLLMMCSCDNTSEKTTGTHILMLVADYTTNGFEGGTVLSFPKEKPEKFTVKTEYKAPGDFGSIKLFHAELNEKIFEGEIVWNGTGKRTFPENLTPAKDFEKVLTKDYILPKNGFENISNPNNQLDNIQDAWANLQELSVVREYLMANREQNVKYFLYTPSVGLGNPAEWKWVFFLTN